jgi:prepilin-type N-terminal cleavage/methylation domain-containing protein
MKLYNRFHNNDGFTLIELLVALILAVLIISPLLGFMVNILDTDRKEQAKATSEQEVQTALDFIARDLQQAVYIYGVDGITNDNNLDLKKSGIKNQIPPGSGNLGGCSISSSATCQPILVFWKRELVKNVFEFSANPDKDDSFVYSLVAYYIVKDSEAKWSNGGKAARITRFKIMDGIQDPGGQTCTGYPTDEKYVRRKSDNKILCPESGFQRFDLAQTIGTLQEKMNSWTKLPGVNYANNAYVLIDFVDQTVMPSEVAKKPNCSFGQLSSGNYMGFYACLDSSDPTKPVAEVFLRANALARIDTDTSRINYNEAQKSYFPSASIRVEGRGYLYTN